MTWFNFKDSAVQGVVVTALVLVVGLSISKSLDLLKIHEVLFAGTFVFFSMLINVLVHLYVNKLLILKWSDGQDHLKTEMKTLRSEVTTATALLNCSGLIKKDSPIGC